jgi:hypothetical protein
MARTNKMWILKKKQQQAKQKGLMSEAWGGEEGIKRTFENPKGHEYVFFLRWWKWICDITSVREDPDGFRIQRSANSGDSTFVHRGVSAWGFRKYIRKAFKAGRK